MYKVKISILCVYTFNEFAHIPSENTPHFPKPPERNKFLQKPLVKGQGSLPGVCGWEPRYVVCVCIFIYISIYLTWSLLSLTRWQRKPFNKVRNLHGINWALNRPWWRQPRQWASASSDRPHQVKRVETHHWQTQKERLTGQPRKKLGDVNFVRSVSKCCELSDDSRHHLFCISHIKKCGAKSFAHPKDEETNFVWGIWKMFMMVFLNKSSISSQPLEVDMTPRSLTHLATRIDLHCLQTSLGAWDFVKPGGQR